MTRPLELHPVSPELFFTRNDTSDLRLGDLAHRTESAAGNVTILGWPDDEGIRLNGGRPGAAVAPDRIRKYLYKMTPAAHLEKNPSFRDLGNLKPQGELGDRHEMARNLVAKTYNQEQFSLTLGGGHDYGFPDAAGFLDHFLKPGKPRPVIINFDAHLDVRSAQHGFNSGTPFRRLLETFPKGSFDFLEIGLQPQCNSRNHRNWAVENGAELWWANEIRDQEHLAQKLKSWLLLREDAPTFVSLDIDVFSSISAPGCSQSWDQGLASDRIFEAFAMIDHDLDWKGLGIYEVSPPLDQDDRTSKLAALAAFDFLTRKS